MSGAERALRAMRGLRKPGLACWPPESEAHPPSTWRHPCKSTALPPQLPRTAQRGALATTQRRAKRKLLPRSRKRARIFDIPRALRALGARRKDGQPVLAAGADCAQHPLATAVRRRRWHAVARRRAVRRSLLCHSCGAECAKKLRKTGLYDTKTRATPRAKVHCTTLAQRGGNGRYSSC